MDSAPTSPGVITAAGGRPLTAKGLATRGRIVSAASLLMLEQSVERTTMEDIQLAAGVNASQLYHYFSGKDELILAVIDHQTEGVLDIHRPALARLDSFEALESWRDVIVSALRRQNCVGGCPIGSLAGDLAETNPVARQALEGSFARWEELLRDGLADMQRRGLLRTDLDIETLALALLAAVQGGLLLSQTRRDTVVLEAALNTAIAHLRTLAAEPGRQ